MGEPWLRREEGKWLRSPQTEEVHNLSVDQLMMEGERKWDVQKIHSLFPSDLANIIMTMPLFQTVREDKLIWDGNKEGRYVVREGYRMLMKEKWRQDERVASHNWNSLWMANAPPKARHVLWRVCRECIPTRVRLLQRQVDCIPNCPLCNAEAEDDYHAFVMCPQVINSWAAAGLSHVLIHRLPNCNNIPELLFDICSKEECDVAGRVAALIWCLWQNRNAKVWSNSQSTPEQVGNQAFQVWKNWFDAQQIRKQSQQTRTVQHNTTWSKPRNGWIKINVDAGFFEHQGFTSTACCVRNDNGEFQGAQTRKYNSNMSILEGEGMAMLDAVKLAIHKGWNFIIFESDSHTLVNAINSKNGGVSEFGTIIDSIKNNLSLLSNFEVKFVRRQANMAAHSLARAAISWASHHFFDVIPPCIEFLLMNDMN